MSDGNTSSKYWYCWRSKDDWVRQTQVKMVMTRSRASQAVVWQDTSIWHVQYWWRSPSTLFALHWHNQCSSLQNAQDHSPISPLTQLYHHVILISPLTQLYHDVIPISPLTELYCYVIPISPLTELCHQVITRNKNSTSANDPSWFFFTCKIHRRWSGCWVLRLTLTWLAFSTTGSRFSPVV